MIIVVSGLPRSGTSMTMRMLEKAGVETLTDETREPDQDNPKGYYEYRPVKDLERDSQWLKKAEGKAVKIVSPLLRNLPPDHSYKVLFTERNLDEVLASQRARLEAVEVASKIGRVIIDAGEEEPDDLIKQLESLKQHVPSKFPTRERDG